MKKEIFDATIASTEAIGRNYALLKLRRADGGTMPAMLAGQFVEVAVPGAGVLLRRPISVNRVDAATGELWLLVRRAGRATDVLASLPAGATIGIVGPLGKGFTISPVPRRALLIGGGVGVAPLLYLGEKLREAGVEPTFLLGARSEADLLELDQFEAVGRVFTSTEDGSHGERGLVTQHSVLAEPADVIYCCGPAPMMKAVARVAREKGVECEVSLENMMACGLGACLCCVEKTVKGNVCVCTEGPVFNINELTW